MGATAVAVMNVSAAGRLGMICMYGEEVLPHLRDWPSVAIARQDAIRSAAYFAPALPAGRPPRCGGDRRVCLAQYLGRLSGWIAALGGQRQPVDDCAG